MGKRRAHRSQLGLFDDAPASIPNQSPRGDTRSVWRRLWEEPNGAWLTEDGKHRLLLWRSWNASARALFVMLNPSVADAKTNDPTIRRCISFAKAWGCGGIHVVNLHSFIATDPDVLWSTPLEDRVAPASAMQSESCTSYADLLEQVIARSRGDVVLAWGDLKEDAALRIAELKSALGRQRRMASCFGTTQRGNPRHPLYLPATAALVPWTPA